MPATTGPTNAHIIGSRLPGTCNSTNFADAKRVRKVGAFYGAIAAKPRSRTRLA
jgi:hypothetical protein